MKVLITGSNGMLGCDLKKVMEKQHDLILATRDDFDITNIDETIKFIEKSNPDIVIHAAAYTDVDGCESNIDLAYKVNSLGARNIAVSCNKIDASLVYISTDYVFDGTKGEGYIETDKTNPQSIYGKSKLAGENLIKETCKKHYIVRTSWLFGENGNNFVKTMLNLAKTKKELTVVNDQFGSPTYTLDLAKAINKLIKKPTYGTFHVTNSEYCSWYEFSKEIFKIANIDIKVEPTTTEAFNRPAPRPKYSVMRNYMLELEGYEKLRSYKEAVKEYIELLDI
ncbi:MAG: dTDP-4-dehydrorhamnose reductase [Firmicutes bacterium]|nr:dTDP-4-dehydrorhamnose reductase [Bacillota bacterium]